MGAFACACFVSIHFVYLFSYGNIPVRVFVLLCVHSCSLYFALIFIKCLLDAFACVYLFLGPHSSARVFMYVFVCMAIPIFSHHYSSFFFMCIRLCVTIPWATSQCEFLFVCAIAVAFSFLHRCYSHVIWVHSLLRFLFLGSQPSAGIEC